MARKKIARNHGESGRVNLSGAELTQFEADIGDPITVDIAESPAIAKAMVESKDADSFIIISHPEQTPSKESTK